MWMLSVVTCLAHRDYLIALVSDITWIQSQLCLISSVKLRRVMALRWWHCCAAGWAMACNTKILHECHFKSPRQSACNTASCRCIWEDDRKQLSMCGLPSLLWGAWQFQPPGLHLACPWHLPPSAEWTSGWKISISLFQINKNITN